MCSIDVPALGYCSFIIKGDVGLLSRDFLHVFYFCLFFTKKYAGILGNAETFGSFFCSKGSEFFVVVKNILILIAMTGENIGNQRLRILDQKKIFVGVPFCIREKRLQDFLTVFSSSFSPKNIAAAKPRTGIRSMGI